MKWLKRLGWLVVSVALLMAAAWLAMPSLLKSQGEKRLTDLLGRAVSIGQVDFKPWSLELTIRQLQVAGLANAAVPLLRAERLHVNMDARSLIRMAPVVKALEVDAPQIYLTRIAAGRYDIDDVLARLLPKTAEKKPSDPLRFALYNIQLKDGAVTLDDRAMAGRIHELNALQIRLPFLSNLPTEVDVKVEPRLAFKLNGAAFDSGAQATPFAQNRASDLKLSFTDVDLQPYLGYIPASVPVRLKRGSVSADVAVKFEMPAGSQPRVSVQGSLGAKGVELRDPTDAPLLNWSNFKVALKDVQPLRQSLQLGDVAFDGLEFHATRDAKGRINLQQWSPAKTTSAAETKSVNTVPTPWAVQLDSFKLNDAQVHWDDAQARPAAVYVLNALNLKTGALAWPVKSDAEVQFTAALTSGVAADKSPVSEIGRLELTAQGSDKQAQVKVQLDALSLQALRPYVAAYLVPQLAGTLAAQAELNWVAGQGGQADQVKLSVAQVTLDGLRLGSTGDVGGVNSLARKKTASTLPARPSGSSLASLARLEVLEVALDLNAKIVTVGSVKLTQPKINVARDAKGVWNVQRWAVATTNQAASTTNPAPTASASPWKVQLRDLALTGGRVGFSDAQPRPLAVAKASNSTVPVVSEDTPAVPVQVELNALKLALQNLNLQGDKTTGLAKLQVSANVTPLGGAPGSAGNNTATVGSASDARRAGTLEWRGQLGLQPLVATGNLRMRRFPVQAFEPYFGDALNVSLLRAEAGYQGEVAVREDTAVSGKPKGMRITLGGDVLLADLLVHTKPTADTRAGRSSTDELLSWQSLTLKGLKVATAPGAPPNVEIQEAALSDFYSRLVITEEGRFNLQDVAAPAGESPVAGDAPVPAEVKTVAAAASAPASAAVAVTSAVASAEPPAFNLVIKSTRLNNGRVDFTDRFIRPNYSANLTELNGGLGEFRTGTRDMATIELRGKAAGTALLDIKGQLNPTAKPLALDIRARATDLELAPFSPYAGKYAGYAIERGKLSVDVSYKIDAAGNLDAKNQVTLNQLTFGDKIESASATKLPVLLAVALLKDRNGVIDINLPVSGSLNNPQFSVFGIVLKVIGNLLVKAFTSPFSLLAGGGADDLSLVGFNAGTANVTEEGRGTLSKVAKALSEKPGLKMTVTGAADPASEREAYVQTLLEQRLLAERKRELVRAGAAPEAPVVMATEDRLRALKEIYKQTDIPNKPRNAIGMARDVPGPEMETLLKTRIVVSAEAMRELALQRGLAVRDALIAQGLPSERLFLAAPKLRASGEDDATWSPRVQLALTAN